MEIYLVGGAVRDQLLGLPVKEKDWVVVGASPQQMLDLGFRQVGRDFPVFLHPQTHDEYALARTERKTGKGYTGFTCYAAPDVTLEDDLKRRDLTINAMAQTLTGEIIDPYGGLQDLNDKVLRHVSLAFVEDPLRILRVARFAARFPDFKVHPTTMILMKQMVQTGEVNDLVAERVWQELVRSLQEQWPSRFFEILAKCGALPVLFPHLHSDAYQNALNQATRNSDSVQIRFAALMHELNKQELENLSDRYRIPREFRELATMIIEFRSQYEKVFELNAEQLLQLLERTDSFRRLDRFLQFLNVCEILEREPGGAKTTFVKNILIAANAVDVQTLIQQGFKGQDIAKGLHEKRVAIIEEVTGDWKGKYHATSD